jgi:hypothetical protein
MGPVRLSPAKGVGLLAAGHWGFLDQAVPVGDDHQLDAVASAEFGEDACNVGFAGRLGNEELAGDLAVVSALSY